MKKCKCVSNNRPMDWQKDPQVSMQPPIEHFYNQPAGEEKEPLKPILIDACIAPVIERLWSKGINTKNSCCGHNGLFEGKKASIIFDNNMSKSDGDEIRKTIAEVDDREFELLSWTLRKF